MNLVAGGDLWCERISMSRDTQSQDLGLNLNRSLGICLGIRAVILSAWVRRNRADHNGKNAQDFTTR